MEIIELIKSYGFPIVACVAMGWYLKYMIDQFRSDIRRISEEHKEESIRMSEALNNNTIVLTKLCTMIDKQGRIDLDDEKKVG